MTKKSNKFNPVKTKKKRRSKSKLKSLVLNNNKQLLAKRKT